MNPNIDNIMASQREFFKSRKSRDTEFLKDRLKSLYHLIKDREDDICKALYDDFRKSKFESMLSETQYILAELSYTIKNLKRWSKPENIAPALVNFPSRNRIHKEPLGQILVMAPWNYPFQLSLAPAIGAIAAGNTVVIKPSELAPHTAGIVKQIISDVFDEAHVCVLEGGVETSSALLEFAWDHIFFTGSSRVGKIVYEAAARHLTPVTLELGGKNPCIIDGSVNTLLTARRIVWGKFLNAGQTCIAPDYLIVKEEIKEELLNALRSEIIRAYGASPELSPDLPRIISHGHFNRLMEMIQNEKIIFGGTCIEEELYIAPTLIDSPSLNSKVMQEEIFGPLLPVLTYRDEGDIRKIIDHYEKPLAFYVFSNDKGFAKKLINGFSFGGGALNDTLIQFGSNKLPFGGVGHSGIGAYHGKMSFDIFSHHKAVVTRANWPDLTFRYAPYEGKLNILKWLHKLL